MELAGWTFSLKAYDLSSFELEWYLLDALKKGIEDTSSDVMILWDAVTSIMITLLLGGVLLEELRLIEELGALYNELCLCFTYKS